jgi:hypothetical protein
MKSKFSDE